MSTGTSALPRIGVVGAGTMGCQLALVFAAGGHEVFITDSDPNVLATAEARINHSATAWLGSDGTVSTLARVSPAQDLSAAVREAGVVIEAVYEDLLLKKDVFAQLETAAPETCILCSNTSSLPISEITAGLASASRMVGMHWFNPAQLIPAVEIIAGEATHAETLDRVDDLLRGLGKVPVRVKDMPGFLANRLQFALVREAILCVEEGVATPEAIDLVVANSLGLRLAIAGPLRVADYAGLDVYASVFDTLAGRFGERFESPELLRRMVQEGRLGLKAARGFGDYTGVDTAHVIRERDQMLLALARTVQGCPEP